MSQEVVDHFSHKASIPYDPDSKHNFMHNKVAVCDDNVFTGSFNLSQRATKNAEKVLVHVSTLLIPYKYPTNVDYSSWTIHAFGIFFVL